MDPPPKDSFDDNRLRWPKLQTSVLAAAPIDASLNVLAAGLVHQAL
jgi:hypothetical protein